MIDFAVALYYDVCFTAAATAYKARELLVWILMLHSSDAVLVEEVLEIFRTEVGVTVADVATCKAHNAVCEFELTVADCEAIRILTLCVADDSTRTTVVAILDSYGPVVHGEELTIIDELEGVAVVKAVDSSVLDSNHDSRHKYYLHVFARQLYIPTDDVRWFACSELVLPNGIA